MLARIALTLAATLYVAAGGAGCSDSGTVVPDGAAREAGTARDASDAPPPQSVDFVVQDCPRWVEGHCEGAAPLSLTFALLSAGIDGQGDWDFGDGTQARGRVVSHVFAAPGDFDVGVTMASSSGTVGEQKARFVRVKAAPAGAACQRDDGCASGRCVCSGTCSAPLSDGLCLAGCAQKACPAGSSCVDLGRGGVDASKQPWRTKLCLQTCSSDAQCARAGFGCRLAPVAQGGGWRKVCLPSYPSFVGAPCRDASGKVDDTRCLGGRCLDIGAGGYCTAVCDGGGCPDGTRCAKLTKLTESVCLLRCASGLCAGDALLACEEPQVSGDWGFSIVGPADPANTTYCAVKRCQTAAQCGVGGRCDIKAGGFCGFGR